MKRAANIVTHSVVLGRQREKRFVVRTNPQRHRYAHQIEKGRDIVQMGNPDAGRNAGPEPPLPISLAGHEEIGYIDDRLVRRRMGIHLPMLGQSLAMVLCIQDDIILIRRIGNDHSEEFIHRKTNPVVIDVDGLLTSGRAGVNGFRCFHTRLPHRKGRFVRVSIAIVEAVMARG